MIHTGLLIIRLVIGLTFMGHGAQKMFGWFSGPGLKGTAGWLESIGIKPGMLNAFLAALAELIGGFLFAAGNWLWVGAALDCDHHADSDFYGTWETGILGHLGWI